MKILMKTVASLAVGAIAATAATADTIRATSGLGPSHVMATTVYPKLFEKLSEFTDGRWDGRDTPSGLVSLGEMNSALRDGVTEVGVVIMPYFAADYPESSLITDLAVLGKDNRAISSAATEYIITCAECLAEFAGNGQVFTGADATSPYNWLTTKRMESAADVAGVRLRTAGPVFSGFVESLGGIPVQMSASELFEGLSQGVLDGTFSSSAELITSRLYEVVTSVTEIEEGIFCGAAVTNVGQILWSRMSPEDRDAFAHAAQYAASAGLYYWNDKAAEAKKVASEAGIEFVAPDDSLKAAKDEFNKNYLANLPATLEARGVKDGQAKIDRFLGLVEKWEGLVAGVDSPDALAELRYQEIWSKLDYSTFGL